MGLVGSIVLPPLVVFASSKWIIHPWKSEDLSTCAFVHIRPGFEGNGCTDRLVYPIIFAIVAGIQLGSSMSGVYKKWTQNIRDKEFLVEMRLRNLELPALDSRVQDDMIDIEDNEGEFID